MSEKQKYIKCKKVSFVDKISAEITLKQIIKNNTSENLPQRAYECNKCGYWHLTTKPDINLLIEENSNLKKKVNELTKLLYNKQDEKGKSTEHS